jgi:hypothetical protein
MFSEYPQEAALDTPKQKALPRLAAHGPETSASVGLDLLPVDVFRISTGSSFGHAEAESPATTGRAWIPKGRMLACCEM